MISLLGVNIPSLVFFPPEHPEFMLIIQNEDKVWLTQKESSTHLNEAETCIRKERGRQIIMKQMLALPSRTAFVFILIMCKLLFCLLLHNPEPHVEVYLYNYRFHLFLANIYFP